MNSEKNSVEFYRRGFEFNLQLEVYSFAVH